MEDTKSEFKKFLNQFEPKLSSKNITKILQNLEYISTLPNGQFNFENYLSQEKYDQLIIELHQTLQIRNLHTPLNDLYEFRVALNFYRQFVHSSILRGVNKNDIRSILQEIEMRLTIENSRNQLIRTNPMCAISNSKMAELLIATPIKPWTESSELERMDSYNYLLLLPTFDVLFRKNLISFTEEGKIIVSDLITPYERKLFQLSNTIQIDLDSRSFVYMSYHRKKLKTN